MKKDFKMCWVSHEKVYLRDGKGKTFTINMVDLREILTNADLKATKQLKNYKLSANDITDEDLK